MERKKISQDLAPSSTHDNHSQYVNKNGWFQLLLTLHAELHVHQSFDNTIHHILNEEKNFKFCHIVQYTIQAIIKK